jgi:hypothetical protein
VSTWTIPEICCAIEHGYRVLDIYECYAYFEVAPLFKKFFKLLASFKVRCEDFPEGVKGNPEAELAYCRQINEDMGFVEEGVALTPEMMCLNEGQRGYIKTLLNSLLGKTAQRTDRVQQQFLMSQDDLDNFLFKAQSDILSWMLISPNVLYMRSKKKGAYLPPNRVCNVTVGAHVTAYGRILMQEAMEKIYAAGGTMAYTDTGLY